MSPFQLIPSPGHGSIKGHAAPGCHGHIRRVNGLTMILGTAQLPRLSLAEMLFETRSMWQ
jgi:hypothetical protein